MAASDHQAKPNVSDTTNRGYAKGNSANSSVTGGLLQRSLSRGRFGIDYPFASVPTSHAQAQPFDGFAQVPANAVTSLPVTYQGLLISTR